MIRLFPLPLLLLLAFCFPFRAASQLTVNKDIPLDSLVRQYFAGSCAEISNITFKGWSQQIGYFNGVNSNIGIEEGIILTSGAIQAAPGPNLYPDMSWITGRPGDWDLSNLIAAPTYDAAVLEFDFVSFKDTVSFEYVFASEEYLEYVGSRFNDVFGFFVSGPGITGAQNIALVPGTSIPVAINAVNDVTNSLYYTDNANGQTVEYDGFTKVLKALLVVLPCTTYHMKLAVADVSDRILDSGVFLKAGSFNPGTRVTVIPTGDPPEGGCYTGGFRFKREGGLDSSIVIKYRISGTATNGSDYTAIADSIVFPKGSDKVDLEITALQDSVNDPDELIILSVDNVCNCVPEIAQLKIVDKTELSLAVAQDTSVCLGASASASVSCSGGSGRYTFTWSDSLGNGPGILVTPKATSTYHVTVYDTVYKCFRNDSVRIVVNGLPVADAGQDAVICPGFDARIGKPASGGHGPYTYQWNPRKGLSDPGSATPLAKPDTTTTYTVLVISADGCISFDTVTVFTSGLAIDAGPDQQLCKGTTAVIGGTASGGQGPFTYSWSPSFGLSDPSDATPTVDAISTTRYIVSVTNKDGCKGSDTVVVYVSDPKIDAGMDTAMCLGGTVRIGGVASSGYTPYTYSWSPSTGLDATDIPMPLANPQSTTSYELTVTDAFGCIVRDTVLVTIHLPPKPVIAPGGPIVLCEGDQVVLDAGSGYRIYSWSTGENSQTITVTKAGSFSISVLDSNGCSGASTSVDVSFLSKPFPVITGPVKLCAGSLADYFTPDVPGSEYDWEIIGGILLGGDSTSRVSVKWDAGGTGIVRLRNSRLLAGCYGDTSLTVLVSSPSPPVILPSGSTSFCLGDSVVLEASPGFASYRWSNGETTGSITVRQSGSFSVTVTDSIGCTAVSNPLTVTVHPNPQPLLSALGPLSFCLGDSVSLDAGGGYRKYSWSNGAKTRFITVLTSGWHSVMVEDSNGCVGWSDTLQITVFPLPVAAITVDRYDLSTRPARTYRWLFEGQAIPGAVFQTHTAMKDGTYQVAITDSNGCSALSPPVYIARMNSTVALPELEGAPGEEVVIPLTMTESKNLEHASSMFFETRIRYNKSLLLPAGGTPQGRLEGPDRVLSLRRNDAVLSVPLTTLEFTVTLGDADSTVLHFDSFTWDDDRIAASTIDGMFRLKTCREGGARLFQSTGVLALKQNRPNPFNAATIIEYEIIEQGPTRLFITDMLGRVVAMLVDGIVVPGAYRVAFDAQNLSSGLYYMVLHTMSHAIRRPMIVSK